MQALKMKDDEMKMVNVGAGITLTSVMAILTIGIVAVIAFKLFLSKEGKTTIPGGFKFEWDA